MREEIFRIQKARYMDFQTIWYHRLPGSLPGYLESKQIIHDDNRKIREGARELT